MIRDNGDKKVASTTPVIRMYQKNDMTHHPTTHRNRCRIIIQVNDCDGHSLLVDIRPGSRTHPPDRINQSAIVTVEGRRIILGNKFCVIVGLL